MPHLLRVLLAAIVLLPLIGLSAEPVLLYERVHRQVAHQDSTVRLVVYDDNRVEATFPFYSPNAGKYSWTITQQEREALIDLAAPVLQIQTDRLLQAVEARSGEGLAVVTDADRVTIELLDAFRGSNRISAPSPEIWARNLPDSHQMAAVADIARQLADWMREQVRERHP